MQLTTLMDRLRARSLHQASWMCLSTSLSAVSPAVLLSSFQFVVIISELLFEKNHFHGGLIMSTLLTAFEIL